MTYLRRLTPGLPNPSKVFPKKGSLDVFAVVAPPVRRAKVLHALQLIEDARHRENLGGVCGFIHALAVGGAQDYVHNIPAGVLLICSNEFLLERITEASVAP
jgi:hypothetical protein